MSDARLQHHINMLEEERNRLRAQLQDVRAKSGGIIILIHDTIDELQDLEANLRNLQNTLGGMQ